MLTSMRTRVGSSLVPTLRGQALLLWVTAAGVLAPSTTLGAGSPRAQEWLARMTDLRTVPFRIEFQRRLPNLIDTNGLNLTFGGKKATLSATPVDWFQSFCASERFIIYNSVQEDAPVDMNWPTYRAFRWVAGFDSRTYWLVCGGASLSVCSVSESGPPPGSEEPKNPFPGAPPRSFGEALHSVVLEVVHLGIPVAPGGGFRVEGNRFAARDVTGEKISGSISNGEDPDHEWLSYDLQPSGRRFRVELVYASSLLPKSFPTLIRRMALRGEGLEPSVSYEVKRYSVIPISQAEPAFACPSPNVYSTNGTAILYSNKLVFDLRNRTLVGGQYATAKTHYRRWVIVACLAAVLALPAIRAALRAAGRLSRNPGDPPP